jgi:hypothetical protein
MDAEYYDWKIPRSMESFKIWSARIIIVFSQKREAYPSPIIVEMWCVLFDNLSKAQIFTFCYCKIFQIFFKRLESSNWRHIWLF